MTTTPSFRCIYGQTEDPLEVTLSKGGTPIPLPSGTLVHVLLAPASQSGAEQELQLVPDADAASGVATYDFANGYPSAGAGAYLVRYRITHLDNDVDFVPNTPERLLFIFDEP